MRILLIEDDKKTAGFIEKGLKEAGFAVDHCADGSEGLLQAAAFDYDLIIADLMLPGTDGISIIKTVRKQKTDIPIIILSARHSLDYKVKGLEAGADDYLTKPFAFAELMARIQALFRRSSGGTSSTSLRFCDLEMDLLSREVTRGGIKIDLKPREFALLEYMMRNAKRVITRTMILEHIWDMNFDPSTNIVDVLLCRLREKVDKDFDKKLIHTIRGAGYVLKEDS